MPVFSVTYEMYIDAAYHVDAARTAAALISDVDSYGPVFGVKRIGCDEEEVVIDTAFLPKKKVSN